MATKRKKSDELWLQSPSDQLVSTDYTTEFELSVEKYIELKQRIELLEEEKDKNLRKLRQLEQTIQEADTKCANHLRQLVELQKLVSDLETKLEQKSEQYDQVIKQLSEEKEHYVRQEEKWQVFQKDLLTTVRVANDLKTEAEEQSESLLNENRTLSEKIRDLERELGELKLGIANDTASDRTEQPTSKTASPSTDSIVFRKKTDHKPASSKRNANCFTELNNSLGNKPASPVKSNEKTALGSKLLRQQSADSVFSSVNRPDKFASSRNSSSQSLKSISSVLDQQQSKGGKKSQISVKTLVETIENAAKTTLTSKPANHQQVSSSPSSLMLSKSPSFNSINLSSNDKLTNSSTHRPAGMPFDTPADRPVSLNTKLQPLFENGASAGGRLGKFDSRYDEQLNKLPTSDAKKEEQLMNRLNDRMNDRAGDPLHKRLASGEKAGEKHVTKPGDDQLNRYKSTDIFGGDKLTSAKLNDKLNKMDKLDKYESIKSKYNKELMRTRLHKKENNCPPIKIDDDGALNNLIKDGGSKRNALLKWCQNKTRNYDGIDITNFSR